MASSGASNSVTASLSQSAHGVPADPASKDIGHEYGTVNSKDIGYEYGTVMDKNLKAHITCNFCGKKITSGITRFKEHLVHKRGNCSGCTKVLPHVQARVQRALNEAIARKSERARVNNICAEGGVGEDVKLEDEGADAPRPPTTTTTGGTTTVATATATSGRKRKASSDVRGPMDLYAKKKTTIQTTLDASNPVNQKLKLEAWDAYARWAYSAGIPFNAVHDPNFQKFIDAVGDYGRGMPQPSYHNIRITLMTRILKEMKDFVASFRPLWKEYGCSIMLDFWTDGKGRSLISFLVNCPKGTVFLKSIDASEHIKDRHLIVGMIEEVIADVGPENIVQLITDNQSNFKAAGEILMEQHQNLYWTPCAAHCINLMLQDLGKDIEKIKEVLVQARKVVVYIYNHGRVLNMMRNLSRSELHRSCVTRFATSFYTLESMHKNKCHLQTLFVSSTWTRSSFAKTAEGKSIQVIVGRESFWKNVQFACGVMAPLVDVIRMVDREEEPCMGYIYDAIDRAKMQIEENLVSEPRMISRVCEIVEKRWKDQLDHPLHSAGYYLNPAIFYKHSKASLHNTKRRLYMALDRLVRDVVENDRIRIQLNDYEDAALDFGSNAAIRLRDKVSPSQWWNMHGLCAPELTSFAIRVLGQTCSASPCERNWSAIDNLHTKKRNCLLQLRLNKLVFIQYNMKLERRFKDAKNKSKTFDPIILREVEENDDWIIPTEQELADFVWEDDDLQWHTVRAATGTDEHVGPSTTARARLQRSDSFGKLLDGGGDSSCGSEK